MDCWRVFGPWTAVRGSFKKHFCLSLVLSLRVFRGCNWVLVACCFPTTSKLFYTGDFYMKVWHIFFIFFISVKICFFISFAFYSSGLNVTLLVCEAHAGIKRVCVTFSLKSNSNSDSIVLNCLFCWGGYYFGGETVGRGLKQCFNLYTGVIGGGESSVVYLLQFSITARYLGLLVAN